MRDENPFRDADLFYAAGELEFHPYIFAKTMPDNPHWYTVRKKWPDDAFETVAAICQEYGEKTRFEGNTYRQLALNGYTYWTMGWPPAQTVLINRKRMFYESVYDELAGKYAGMFAEERHKTEDEEVAAIIGDVEGLSVLDVGCGVGGLLDILPAPPAEYVGIDHSIQMLMRFGAAEPSRLPSLINTTFEDFFPSRQFDRIVALYGAGHAVGSVAKLRRMLKPEGIAVVMLYSPLVRSEISDCFQISESLWEPDGLPNQETCRVGYHRVYVINA